MKIDAAYFERLLLGAVEDAIADLAQVANFWSVRAHVTEQGELEGLSHSEATVHLMMIYTGEVGNGGHLQYFANNSGALAENALQALRELDETDLATALERALQVFPGARAPKDRSERVACLQGLNDDQLQLLDDMDHKVWPHISSVDERALAYLRAHQDDVLVAERR